MKISKLFHWLYGFLMLLPVFAVGVKCAYVVLNQNANESYQGSYSYSSTVSLRTIQGNNAISYNTITYNDNSYTSYVSDLFNNHYNGSISAEFLSYSLSNVVYFNCDNLIVNNQDYSQYKFVCFWRNAAILYAYYYDFTFNTEDYYLVYSNYAPSVYLKANNTYMNPYSRVYSNAINISFDIFDKSIYGLTNISFANMFNDIYTNIYLYDSSLSSVFYSSIEELDKVSFFSWARHSFISEPFLYIGNLFGVPDVHPIFTFFSYWMAISVIWLVFDLFMYVPLLVHRWIDKAKVD